MLNKSKELAATKTNKSRAKICKTSICKFQSIRFGIEACCYTDLWNQAVTKKRSLCDWQNASSNKDCSMLQK